MEKKDHPPVIRCPLREQDYVALCNFKISCFLYAHGRFHQIDKRTIRAPHAPRSRNRTAPRHIRQRVAVLQPAGEAERVAGELVLVLVL